MDPVRSNDTVFGNAPGQVGGGTMAPEAQRVLRNTYLLLALTMVPTVAGAYLGMATASIITGSPILSFFVMLGAVIGLQFGIAHYRNSVIGIGLLLLMTGLLGAFLGPLLNYALALKNGIQLVGYAAFGTAAVFTGMAMVAITTKRDFSFMGKFLFVGMLVLLVAVYRYFKPPFPRSARAAGSREAVNRAVFGDNPPLSMTIHLLTPALN